MRRRNGFGSAKHLFTLGAAAGAAVLLAACENPQPPGMCGAIPDQTVVVGERTTVSACFDDPNGDVLSYVAASSDAGVATVSASGSTVTVTAVSPGTSVVTVTATDATDLAGSQQFRVLVPNRAPVAVGEIATREIPAGESAAVDVSAHFMEPDGQPLTYALGVSDEGILTVSAEGAVVTLEALAKGTATVTATATDPGGLSAVQSFLVTVPNRTPGAVGSMPAQTIEVDAAFTTDVTGYFTDPDGDDLTYTAASSDPSITEVSLSGGELTVTAVAKGEATVTVTATDTEGLTATQQFAVTVPNRPPLVAGTIEGRTIEVGEAATLDLSGYFTDPDGDALVYTAAPSGVAVAGARVEGADMTVTALAKGEATVTVTATDTEGLAATQAFAVIVPNQAPLATGSMEERILEVGETAALELSDYFSDPDGDDLAYAATSSNATVMGVEVSDGAVTVTALGKGGATIAITATDTDGESATRNWVVSAANQAPLPVGSIEGSTIEVGETAIIELSDYFSDPDGDDISYEAASSDPAVTTAAVTGSTLSVAAIARGIATVTLTATDTEGLSATREFAVTVPNRAPQAVSDVSEMEVSQGGIRRVDPATHFVDPDGDPLVFDAESSRPSVARAWIATNGVVIRGINDGTATVTITAKDPDESTATLSFRVRVTGSNGGSGDPNQPPVVTGKILSQDLQEGDKRMVDASSYFNDPDNDELEFSASSSNTDVVKAATSGAEVELEVVAQGTATVTVTAEDPEGLETSQDFGVEVTEAGTENRAPAVVGTVAAQTLEENASTTLDASDYFTDPDGDALTFSVESSDSGVVTVTASGNNLALKGVAEGSATVTVTAADPEGLSTELNIAVTVEAGIPNRSPEAGTIPAQRVKLDNSKTLDATTHFTDPDDDELTFTAVSSDIGVVTVTASGGDIELRAVAEGTATVTVTAEDPGGLSASARFQVTIIPAGSKPPRVTKQPVSYTFLEGAEKVISSWWYFWDPDDEYSDLKTTATSSDPDVLTAEITSNRGGIRLSAEKDGEATITITVTDPDGLSASVSVVQTVGNNAPTVNIELLDVVRSPDEEYEFFLQVYVLLQHFSLFVDNDIGDAMTFSVESSDTTVAKAEIYDNVISLHGLITAVGLGETTITATATDKGGLSTDYSFKMTVNSNRPPRLKKEIPDYVLTVPDSIVLPLSDYFEDPEGDSLTYTISKWGGTVDAYMTGDTLVITRAYATIYVYASDPEGRSTFDEFEAEVLEASESQSMTNAVTNSEISDEVKRREATPVRLGRPPTSTRPPRQRPPPGGRS